ncbi:MAG: hypothetical protein LBE31_02545 [Deltaproteobacteria bacterium]|jgi:hypothetical protein|nr:hypothetical protein [Deltaproteobacteria bacterium]
MNDQRDLLWFGVKKFGLIIFLFLTLTILGGCLNVAIRDHSGPSSLTSGEESFAEFLDVPYPASMTLERDNTFTYSRRNVLAGVVSVVGRFSVEELALFYDQHLPGHGWTPLAEAQNVKLVSTWTKGGKVLTIIATPIIMAIGGNLRVELWVAPPHTKADLGKRMVYQNSGNEGERTYSTKPTRGQKDGITQEDL